MAEHQDTTGNYETALAAAEKGIVSIPCHPGTKIPCVKWKEWQTKMPPQELLEEWFQGTRNNIAIITSGMVVFDCEDLATAELVIERCGDTPHKLRTPNGGVHLGFKKRKGVDVKNQVQVKGLNFDFRTDGGIEMIPPSITPDGAYEWLGEGLNSISDLPLAKVGWTRVRTRRRVKASLYLSGEPRESRSRVRNPEAYCLRIESVQGQNGSKGLVRVVCVLRDAGRSPQQAFDFLIGPWNAACARPAWSESEILHAIQRHYKLA